MQVHNVAVVGKRHHEVGGGRTDVADQNAADDEHGHPVDFPGNSEYKTHGEHGAEERRQDHGKGPGVPAGPQAEDHGSRHQKFCAGGNTQDKRPRNGVVEIRLQQVAGQGQRPAENQGRRSPWQPQLQDNITALFRCRTPEEDMKYIAQGDGNGADADIQKQEQHKQPGQSQVNSNRASAVSDHTAPSFQFNWYRNVMPSVSPVSMSCRSVRNVLSSMDDW